jgi:hypothetical protein
MRTEVCRLCHAPAHYRFERLILEKYLTPYFECSSCGSLQTERPHWLAEAYRIPGVHIDVGQAARVIQTWLRLSLVLKHIGFDNSSQCIDYGGSAGLLTRLMRDSGYNYFAYDFYDHSKYANYFQIQDLSDIKASLISAFEVIEHLPEPRLALAEMLANEPELLIFTTQFYEGQGPDWPYLVPFCGQHVFFYTLTGLQGFALSFGYDIREVCGFWAFVRRGSRYEAAIATLAESGKALNATFAGEHVMSVGWGTDFTERDGSYAFERFIRELKGG